MNSNSFNWKQFTITVLITSLWINVSEVFRYFVLVRPRVKTYWNGMEQIADMNWTIFAIWGFWDTVLTVFVVIICWLYIQVFGNTYRSIVMAGTIAWSLFALFWIATANMGYSDWSILWITLPLSWIEMVIAGYIVSKLYSRQYEQVQNY